MLFGKKKGLAIETLLGAHTKLEGNLRFSGGLRIDGEISGNIYGDPDKPSMLVITDSARVEGEVHVGHLILNGTVVGPVHVAELLELQPKARIEGNVQYAALEMHQGAVVMGTLMHAAPSDVKLLPNLKLASNQD
ncbi:bactofilin family protein [Ralstonia chuxiongensis]|uniref:Polymer-forming cytoskeletal protein n=1 Tax=Ralstonia chuxiongensis TaxID=2957504 RepID=A0AA42BHT5_9RALS|nr:polymer-forming cytoskeletal protein [Ralstonia chuxiongensis]MCP1172348.1 polymer-forming cytoskeletal protein [Ralstonia chuxiongensis]